MLKTKLMLEDIIPKDSIAGEHLLKIIESIILVILFLFSKYLFGKLVDRFARKFNYQSGRVKVFKKLVNLMILLLIFIIFLAIWGVDQEELTVFVSSMVTVLGIAFFAQWSILSNITSSIIIFFNHPITIGDELTILDKDYDIEGNISDIGIFFITIKTKAGELVSIPSSVLMQKMIKRMK